MTRPSERLRQVYSSHMHICMCIMTYNYKIALGDWSRDRTQHWWQALLQLYGGKSSFVDVWITFRYTVQVRRVIIASKQKGSFQKACPRLCQNKERRRTGLRKIKRVSIDLIITKVLWLYVIRRFVADLCSVSCSDLSQGKPQWI